MVKWLKAALDYIPQWVEFQMRQHEQPGCVVAVAHQGRIVLEEAFGHADLVKGTPLTPRHRFRVASHSKSFTAAGIMKLREKDKLRLDDRVGRYVDDLHPAVARVTIAQLLSHSAGIVRDGPDGGQFLDRRPFLDAEELRAQLTAAPAIAPNTRFKYSNHGYGLVGFVIEAVTGEPYLSWIKREIVDAAGLDETFPDVPLPQGTPLACGHSSKLPLGRRVVIPGDYPTHAIAPAGGFVSTARDLARYFAQLSPNARSSVLSVESRREMIRRQWRDPHSSLEHYYGLGIISGSLDGWDWFGHAGGLQGYISRTSVLPDQELALSVLTNAVDGLAHFWLDGAIHILRAFAQNGAPLRKVSGWAGRWWTLWGAIDLVPMGGKVMVAIPAYFSPFMDASELEVRSRNDGRIGLAGGYASHGEPARLVRNSRGDILEVWLGGMRFLREAQVAKEMTSRYQKRR
jgi:CubicO group peptidase (beta-lactamase class C family)